jgi:hypothetical protein
MLVPEFTCNSDADCADDASLCPANC